MPVRFFSVKLIRNMYKQIKVKKRTDRKMVYFLFLFYIIVMIDQKFRRKKINEKIRIERRQFIAVFGCWDWFHLTELLTLVCIDSENTIKMDLKLLFFFIQMKSRRDVFVYQLSEKKLENAELFVALNFYCDEMLTGIS